MEIDDGQLIELVRQFSIIYDTKHKGYRNNEEKSNAWKTIGQVMNRPAAECEARWATLRSLYNRGSKKVKVLPSGSGGKKKSWIWLEEMSFLSGYVRRRKTTGNVTKPEELDNVIDVWDTMSHILHNVEVSEQEDIENKPQVEESAEKKRRLNVNYGASTSTAQPSNIKLRNEAFEKKKES